MTNYGAAYVIEDDQLVITNVFPVDADWDGYRFHGYCRPTLTEIKAAGFETGCEQDTMKSNQQLRHNILYVVFYVAILVVLCLDMFVWRPN
jgi:hypothetical protein